jgi:RNA 2',3'-cyclic 3'-phosphodiesterase
LPGQRLFFALCPDGEIQSRLAGIARRTLVKGGRLVPVENLHMTLVFLGKVSPGQRECAQRAAAGVAAAPFSLELDHLGHWPRPRVVWSGPGDTPRPLVELVSALQAALSDCGFPPEARPFRAHVTVARKVASPMDPISHEPVHWPVEAFHLMESRTLPGGVRYTSLARWPLQGSGVSD